MATKTEPAVRSIKLTNMGQGPRSFIKADNTTHILRPNETFEGDVREADMQGLSADLVEGDVDTGSAGVGVSAPDHSQFEYPSLDGLNRDQLLAVAVREGYPTMGTDATEDQLRDAIENARKAAQTEAGQEAAELAKGSRDKLVETARKEGVAIEGDDNKGQIALKIAQNRQLQKAPARNRGGESRE
jgi:hypothetical protein